MSRQRPPAPPHSPTEARLIDVQVAKRGEYRGRGELIDHIFASHRLVNPTNLPKVEIIAATPLPSVDDTPPAQQPTPSDHAAVVATFTT